MSDEKARCPNDNGTMHILRSSGRCDLCGFDAFVPRTRIGSRPPTAGELALAVGSVLRREAARSDAGVWWFSRVAELVEALDVEGLRALGQLDVVDLDAEERILGVSSTVGAIIIDDPIRPESDDLELRERMKAWYQNNIAGPRGDILSVRVSSDEFPNLDPIEPRADFEPEAERRRKRGPRRSHPRWRDEGEIPSSELREDMAAAGRTDELEE